MSTSIKMQTNAGDVRRFSLATSASFAELQAKIETLLDRPVAGKLLYLDDEGDKVRLSSDEELSLALSSSQGTVRLFESGAPKPRKSAQAVPVFDLFLPVLHDLQPFISIAVNNRKNDPEKGNCPCPGATGSVPCTTQPNGQEYQPTKQPSETSKGKAGAEQTTAQSMDTQDSSLIDILPDQHLTHGDWGLPVLALQKILLNLGYLERQTAPRFGYYTREALLKYQKAHGIVETGEYDSITAASLRSLLEHEHQEKTDPSTNPVAEESTPLTNESVSEFDEHVGTTPDSDAHVETIPDSDAHVENIPDSETDGERLTECASEKVETGPTSSEARNENIVSLEVAKEITADSELWREPLKQLEGLGFHDVTSNLRLLNEHKGDLRRVLLNLLDIPKAQW